MPKPNIIQMFKQGMARLSSEREEGQKAQQLLLHHEFCGRVVESWTTKSNLMETVMSMSIFILLSFYWMSRLLMLSLMMIDKNKGDAIQIQFFTPCQHIT